MFLFISRISCSHDVNKCLSIITEHQIHLVYGSLLLSGHVEWHA